MESELFSLDLGGQIIHGIINIPDGKCRDGNKVVLFLNGIGGYRSGPHDMFIFFSREFTKSGYHCVRFDFRGKGFSGQTGFLPTPHSMLEDIGTIVGYINEKLETKAVYILGICLGAKLALAYAKNSPHPIQKLILLSSTPLREENVMLETARQQSTTHLREYVVKALKKETWIKVFTGRIHYRKIFDTIVKPFRNVQHKNKPKTAPRDSYPTLAINENVLVIHAEHDPDTLVALPQIESFLEQNHIPFHSHIIKGANHSFYSLDWTQEIWDIIKGDI